jgi:hypothetical protein
MEENAISAPTELRVGLKKSTHILPMNTAGKFHRYDEVETMEDGSQGGGSI